MNQDYSHINVLIACEESQAATIAFRAAGATAFSCDLIKCSGKHPDWHIQHDAREVIQGAGHWPLQNGETLMMEHDWDLIIAHPPCTMLAKSSATALWKGQHTIDDVTEAAQFFMTFFEAPARFVCIENPIPLKIACLPPYSQIVQPFDFGHNYSKATCLWLRNLPPLLPTHGKFMQPKSWVYGGSHRAKRRSKSFAGIVDAMANQWLPLIASEIDLRQ